MLDVGAGYMQRMTFRGEVNLDVNRPEKPIPNFVLGDCHHLPFKSNSIEQVYCYHLIEHIESPFQALNEIFRVLKNPGKLFLATPNAMDLYNTLRTILRGSYVPYVGREAGKLRSHIQTWGCEELRAILSVIGFKHIVFRFVNHGRKRLVDPLLCRWKLSRTLEATAWK